MYSSHKMPLSSIKLASWKMTYSAKDKSGASRNLRAGNRHTLLVYPHRPFEIIYENAIDEERGYYVYTPRGRRRGNVQSNGATTLMERREF